MYISGRSRDRGALQAPATLAPARQQRPGWLASTQHMRHAAHVPQERTCHKQRTWGGVYLPDVARDRALAGGAADEAGSAGRAPPPLAPERPESFSPSASAAAAAAAAAPLLRARVRTDCCRAAPPPKRPQKQPPGRRSSCQGARRGEVRDGRSAAGTHAQAWPST
jgi:hypothetical protein